MRPATIALAVVLMASAAWAEESPSRTFSLKSASAEACPAVTTFSARVLARTSHAAVTSSGNADVDFKLSVEVAAEGAAGTLEISSAGSSSVRRVRGASCEEVVEALALVAALILDPNAATGPIEAPPPSRETPTTAPPVKPPPALVQQPPRSASRTPSPPPPASLRREPGPPWRFGAGVRAMLTQGVAPDPVVASGAFVNVLLDTDGTAFEPLVLLGVSYAKSGAYDATIDQERLGTASFRWITGDVTGCPIRFPASGTVAARPCVGLEWGRLTGTGTGKHAAEESAPWFAFTAGLKLDWMLFDLLRLDLTAGGFYSLSRDEFFFDTPDPVRSVTVHEIPAAGARAALGLGLLLP